MGIGKPGNSKGGNLKQRELNEPGGLCFDARNRRLFIADTNNHDIKVLEVVTDNVYSVSLFLLTACFQ